jgi:catalase
VISSNTKTGPISFQILVQVANDTDIVDDATDHWPEERPLVDLGRIVLTAPVAANAQEQKKIISIPYRVSMGSSPRLILCLSCGPRSIC